MKTVKIKLFIAICSVFSSMAAGAACSSTDYQIFNKYDKFLENNKSTPDHELRITFAKKIGMQPSDLKSLYMRCTTRWANENPKESNDIVNELFKNNPSVRDSSCPLCR